MSRPLIRIDRVSIASAAIALSTSGCLGVHSAPMTHIPMNYQSCAASRICTLSGTMTAEPAAHAVMGRLQLPEGRCVSVSLPREQIVELRRAGPKLMTVTGRVYGEPPEDQDAILEIQGRRIGLGLCDDFFVFVPDRNSEPARQLSGQPQGRQ